jgi:mRNA interferase RelE/StbE
VKFLQERLGRADDPRSFGHALKGERFRELWRYRVGDHRIITQIEDQAIRILVIMIGHRREIYR